MSDIEENYSKLDKRLALLEQRLDTIQNNHLKHIGDDINTIKKWFGWAVGVVFMQLVGTIAYLLSNM